MSVQSTNGNFAGSYVSRVQSVVPNARPVKHIQVSRSKRHTIQDARAATADKLRDNLAYLRDPDSTEKPDLVYKQQRNGTFAVGIKYGNRWLTGVFDGSNYSSAPDEKAVCDLLELFATDALSGQFDAYIKPIMDANAAARNKY